MLADKNRRVPIKTFTRFVFTGLRLDMHDLARCSVDTGKVTFLPFGIHDIGISRLRRRLVSISKQRNEPVRISNAVAVIRAGRAALGVIILRPAIDVIERLGVIDGDLIELGDR